MQLLSNETARHIIPFKCTLEVLKTAENHLVGHMQRATDDCQHYVGFLRLKISTQATILAVMWVTVVLSASFGMQCTLEQAC